MKKFFLLFFTFLSLPLLPLLADNGVEDLSNVSLGRVKLPLYQDGKPQLFIFADNAVRPEQVLIAKNTFLDLLRDNIDVDRIVDGWDTELYPLNSPLDKILHFWSKRYLTSQAVLFTSVCHLDPKTKNAFGDSPVYLRSPMMDLNGIGFQTNFNTKTTLINADVRIVLRTEEADPREILAGSCRAPKIYKTISAKGDSLRIDIEHSEIMLIGNVKVVDGSDTLECDRLTAFLGGAKKEAAPAGDEAQTGMLKQVERVLADGSVVLTHQGDPGKKPIRAEGEHLEYEIASGIITLTDDEKNPRIFQGYEAVLTGGRIELLKNSEKAFIAKGCRIESPVTDAGGKLIGVRVIVSDKADFDNASNLGIFSGNVQIRDPQMQLDCDQMRFFLKESSSAPKEDSPLEFSPVGGRRELERILCDGNVRVREVIRPAAASETPEKEPRLPGELTSDHGEFDYKGDHFIFTENVHGKSGENTLKCDRLDLFLADKGAGARSSSGKATVPIGGEPGKNKTLRKIIASGHVFMSNKENDLATELLTLHFRDLPDGAAGAPGMFQSGDVQLTRIVCDGSVVAHNIVAPAALPAEAVERDEEETEDGAPAAPVVRTIQAEHAVNDMAANLTEFHEKVSVYDDLHRLDCRDMYVFTGQALPPPGTKPLSPEELDPDYDPFALDESEDSAPSRIALDEKTNLTRIVCQNDVLLTRHENGENMYAGGDKAVYTVATKEIIITAEPPARPYLRGQGRKQFCDRIIGNLATEELKGVGSSELMPDDD